MENIDDQEILKRIIDIQGCIIQGKNLKILLQKDKSFYLKKTNSDAIIICMNDHEKVHPEYVIEDHRVFAHLLHKYVFNKKTLAWDIFVQNHYPALISSKKFYHTNDIYDIFKGILTKREASSFNEELEMKDAILMPLYDFDHKDTIGIVCYLFSKNIDINIKKLEEIKKLFQTLLQPLYDRQYSIIYSKCVRVDEKFSLLTSQERRITKKVLSGKSYVEISGILNISINTLKSHMKNIFNKYNVKSKIALYNKLNTHHKI